MPPPRFEPTLTSKPSKPARSQCPENPSPEQWRRIREWRDAKHPDFTDAELEAQWERHANYHIGKGTLALDWARSFYNWLTGPYYKPATTSGLARAKPEIETFDEAASRRNREWLLSLGGGK